MEFGSEERCSMMGTVIPMKGSGLLSWSGTKRRLWEGQGQSVVERLLVG